MNIENISPKLLNDMERLVQELLAVMRKAKVEKEPIVESLQHLEQELGEARRARFDKSNSEYIGY